MTDLFSSHFELVGEPIVLPADDTRFIVADHFKPDLDATLEFPIASVNELFLKTFGQKIETGVPERKIGIFRLVKRIETDFLASPRISTDETIVETTVGRERAIISLRDFFAVVRMLHTFGKKLMNSFDDSTAYIRDVDDFPKAASISWHKGNPIQIKQLEGTNQLLASLRENKLLGCKDLDLRPLDLDFYRTGWSISSHDMNVDGRVCPGCHFFFQIP
jgi:hypothetical protein